MKELVPLAGTGKYDVSNPCGAHRFSSHSSGYHARCDMETDGGGWLVIQRRINGSVDFYRNWTDYVYGFGDLEGEFWYGLENIHCLTTRDDVELRIEIGNGTTPSIVWTYQLFQVGGAATDYSLTIGEGQGVGHSHDSMAIHNSRPFSTSDNDNDAWSNNCAATYGGGWWYSACHHANLNGPYQYQTPGDLGSRLVWYDGPGGSGWHYFTTTQMKIRLKQCIPESSRN